jgi:cobalt-zinc-cadmium efflux system protein
MRAPPAIDGAIMLSVASAGLVVNVIGALLLHRHAHDNLNVRGAYLHVLGDLLGSVGAIAAGIIVLTTGWTAADPLVSVVIALLILASAWRLVREAAEVLLESAPSHVDLEAVLADLTGIDGLEEVHDVHVWTLTSGFVALSAHGVVDAPTLHTRILDEVRTRMQAHGIAHVTFQIELRPIYQLPARDTA